jgi:hypothetical protein
MVPSSAYVGCAVEKTVSQRVAMLRDSGYVRHGGEGGFQVDHGKQEMQVAHKAVRRKDVCIARTV